MFKDEPGTSTHSQKTVGASIRDTSTSFNTTTHDFVSKHFLSTFLIAQSIGLTSHEVCLCFQTSPQGSWFTIVTGSDI
jgi:hypothetical protein